jgi:hypothetical protein
MHHRDVWQRKITNQNGNLFPKKSTLTEKWQLHVVPIRRAIQLKFFLGETELIETNIWILNLVISTMKYVVLTLLLYTFSSVLTYWYTFNSCGSTAWLGDVLANPVVQWHSATFSSASHISRQRELMKTLEIEYIYHTRQLSKFEIIY